MIRVGSDGRQALRFGLVVALLLIVGLTSDSAGSLESVLAVSAIWAAAAIGWNIAGGLGGELSLGHAFFLAIGAYGGALFQSKTGISPWLGIPLSALLAALVAAPFALLTLRLTGPYFALATFAIAQAAYQVAVWNISFLGGSDGLTYTFNTGFSNMNWGGDVRPYLYIAISLLVIVWLLFWAIQRYRLGFLLRAVRDDEVAARSSGVRTTRIKVIGLMISAAIAAIAGGLLARIDGSVTPDQFLVATVSLQLLVSCYIGGIGSLNGPIWGAAIAIGIPNYVSLDVGSATASDIFAAAVGLVFVLVMILFPGGIAKLDSDTFSGAVRWLRRHRTEGGGPRAGMVEGVEPDAAPQGVGEPPGTTETHADAPSR